MGAGQRLLKLVVVGWKLNCERCVYFRLDISFTTLFWTLFGLITLVVLEIELRYVEGFGKLLFGLYNIAARILLLNMLIAMMSKSFNVTVVSQADSPVSLSHGYLCLFMLSPDRTVQQSVLECFTELNVC